ncbi:MAG: hypothetical protein C4533_08260 [Candidatus Omnitrophota bacterium]|jgi:hypothetical protein|nr:MAG: hypothetical protein C4533_08260 [Candidatus Omnitrophota bacterium]
MIEYMFAGAALKDGNFTILDILLILFVIWLVIRIENRAARNAVYKNFPFFKEAAGGMQQKIDHLNVRMDNLEKRLAKLENK